MSADITLVFDALVFMSTASPSSYHLGARHKRDQTRGRWLLVTVQGFVKNPVDNLVEESRRERTSFLNIRANFQGYRVIPTCHDLRLDGRVV